MPAFCSALGMGNNALCVGNGAMSSAPMANQKAGHNASGVDHLKRGVLLSPRHPVYGPQLVGYGPVG